MERRAGRGLLHHRLLQGASVPVPDPTLAAREVLIFRQGDRYRVRDLAEKGRVLLNGAVTRESVLRDADCVQLGRVLLRFYEDTPGRAGQIVLYPEGGNGSSHAAVRSAPPGVPGEVEARSAAPARGGRKIPPLVVLAAILFVGVLLGYYGGRKPAAPDGGLETVLRSRDATANDGGQAPSAGPTDVPRRPEPSPVEEPPEADPLEKLRKQLETAPSAAPAPATAQAPTLAPAVAPAQGPTQGPAQAPDPWARKRAFHRLFLDVAGRPPTREEAGALAGKEPKAWWEAALAGAPAKPAWSEVPEEAVRALLGREPSADEVRAIRDSGLPPAVALAARDEYGRAERTRLRSPICKRFLYLLPRMDSG